MKILLSPAKKINTKKTLNTTRSTAPVFLKEAEQLIKKLQKLSSKKIGEMMHLSDDLSNLNYERYQKWSKTTEKNEENAFCASAFDGEVYRGLDAETFSEQELIVAQEKIRILSGLYGILKPLDIIYPYRLEMGTKWQITPKTKNLYQFWGKKIAQNINEENEDGIIINLASNEYFKAVDKKTLNGRIITPSFKEFKNGEYKTIMVYAKKARGLMARYIVQNNIKNPEEIKLFNVDGYQLDANQSDENNWVFTR